MRFSLRMLAVVLVAYTVPAHAQSPSKPAPLTLAEAMRLAESAHPSVRTREAQLAAAEGQRSEASSLLFNNPALDTEQTRVRARPDGNRSEWGAGVTQSFELGGQQARRREAAAAGLDAVRAEIEDARRLARADAAIRFIAVLAAQRRVAGEDSRLDANVAAVEVERARNLLALANEKLLEARSELGTALRLPPSALAEVAGELDGQIGDVLPYTLEQLLASAQALPRLRALSAREEAARARLGVERASRLPDLTVGLHVGREGPTDGRERPTTLSLSIPLPLFKRNEAGIGQAMTDMTQAEIERMSVERDSQVRVNQLWVRQASQRGRVQRLQRVMLPAAVDNQQLSTRSRQAGQIGLLDQLIVNRQTLDAERDLHDAVADYHATRIELGHAAGWPFEGFAR